MNDEPNALADVWADVVSELTVDNGGLSKSQKAWLNLVKPITLAQGFALLSVPSTLAQQSIERDLREPILRVLNRNLGQGVEGLGVRVEPRERVDDPAEDPYAEPRDTLPLEGLPTEPASRESRPRETARRDADPRERRTPATPCPAATAGVPIIAVSDPDTTTSLSNPTTGTSTRSTTIMRRSPRCASPGRRTSHSLRLPKRRRSAAASTPNTRSTLSSSVRRTALRTPPPWRSQKLRPAPTTLCSSGVRPASARHISCTPRGTMHSDSSPGCE